jgi:ABC-type nickel/cobalt efflux system permease component RcnA
LLPCPSAIVVMLSAISLHRVGFGLLLIVFFSLGLACVLTAIGFALVYARTIAKYVPFSDAIARRAGQSEGLVPLAVRAFPVGSAAAVVVAGLLVTLNAYGQF